jgi:hypothetical protein
LQMMNALGKIVYASALIGDLSHTTIDVSDLPAGIYWVMMKTESYSFAKKIVIQR